MEKIEIKSEDIIEKIANMPKYIKDKCDWSFELTIGESLIIKAVLPVVIKLNNRNNRDEEPTLCYKGVAITNQGIMEIIFPKFPLGVEAIDLSQLTMYERSQEHPFGFVKPGNSQIKFTIVKSLDRENEDIFYLLDATQFDDEFKEALGLNG